MSDNAPIEQVSLDKIVITNKVPDRVDAAVKLLCLAIIFSILELVMNIIMNDAPLLSGGMAFLFAGYALVGWLVLKISLGRNWARIAFTMLLALQLGREPLVWEPIFKMSIVVGLIHLAVVGLQIAAVVMLWMKDSEAFFEKKAA